jgi:Fe2+ or Zn2+ uptake regulation protein
VKKIDDLLREHQRAVVLRTLEATQGGSTNDAVLSLVLDEFGYHLTRDQVRSELAWLSDQGLVAVEVVGDNTHVATLTERGAEVATDRARQPGVRRPSLRSLAR